MSGGNNENSSKKLAFGAGFILPIHFDPAGNPPTIRHLHEEPPIALPGDRTEVTL